VARHRAKAQPLPVRRQEPVRAEAAEACSNSDAVIMLAQGAAPLTAPLSPSRSRLAGLKRRISQ
jgi:hypothetical protein